MAVSYNKFFSLVSQRNLRTTDILNMTGFSANILTRCEETNMYLWISWTLFAPPLTARQTIFWNLFLRLKKGGFKHGIEF